MKYILLFTLLITACTAKETPVAGGGSVLDDSAVAPSRKTATAPPPAIEPPPTIQGGVRVVPVDEAPQDPSFVQFRDELRAAIAKHDTNAVIATFDPSMNFSFGGERGIDAFRAMWKPDAPDSKLWRELDDVLSLGGSWTTEGPRRFVAPYVYANWPEASDSFENVVPVCQAVPVYAKAEASGAPMARLDYQVVKIGQDDPVRKGGKDPAWREVVLPDGRSGWVESKCVRSPIDYRAAFEKKNGAWKMVFFVAGD